MLSDGIKMEKSELDNTGIGVTVGKQITRYLAAHKGTEVPPGLYYRVIKEVEDALFSSVLKYVDDNQVKASKILGINRNTLRQKINSDS